MTKLILVRHCEAEGNTKGVLQGRTDSNVSGNSAAQLDLIGLRLRNEPIAALYSSPLRRAYKTAEAINRYHDLPIRIDGRLTEIDVGAWEGCTWEEIQREDGPLVRVWNESPGEFQARDGESMRDVYDRMWEAALEIVRAHPGQTVCAVSHGCAIRSFLCRALGKPVGEINSVGWCDNTAVSVVEFDGNLRPRVVKMNDASHIPASLSVYRRDGGSVDEAIAP